MYEYPGEIRLSFLIFSIGDAVLCVKDITVTKEEQLTAS